MDFLQYYGIDWLAMTLTFLAIWQVGNKNKIGFIFMIAGNLSCVLLGYMTASVAMVVANFLFFLMNVWAVIKWSRPANIEPDVALK